MMKTQSLNFDRVRNIPLKTKLSILIAVAACGMAGCAARRDWRHVRDVSPARLLALYESGQINAEQFFSRSRALADWQALHAQREAQKPSEPDPPSPPDPPEKKEGHPGPHPPPR